MLTKSRRHNGRCSVSEERGQEAQAGRLGSWPVVMALVTAAALIGVLLGRILLPAAQPSGDRPIRPIVQFVRQQPGLPDVSDIVVRLCPAVAEILPYGTDFPIIRAGTLTPTPAFAVSTDGWLVAAAAGLPKGPVEAIFGDGQRAALSDIRADPVSGLAVMKANHSPAAPLVLNNEEFARVGQFGFSLNTPAGMGCTLNAGMIASDFLADGGGPNSYLRLQPSANSAANGSPILGNDGVVLGIAAGGSAGEFIPAFIAATIVDELVRNNLSPTANFGFRVIDYPASVSARIGNPRSGAGVALVQPKSGAERAGLQAGDMVAAVNGGPVSGASELGRVLDSTSAPAILTVMRGTRELNLTVYRAADAHAAGRAD